MTNSSNKVLLAMSGGTDSSVAAIILKNNNFQLHGVTFRAYDSISHACMEKETGCCSVDSIFEAKKLAESLGFNHHIMDVRDYFEETVIQNFINEYLKGRTPNPCVVCNQEIKWNKMIEEANRMNCSFLATGHYAQIIFEDGRYFIRKGVDKTKDQSYFLWTLTQNNLARTLFPLGKLTKTEVRNIAKLNNYEKLATKRESQEICFIPDDDYRNFLKERIRNIDEFIGEGNVRDINGKILGKHKGYPFYTIGQRRGLNIAMGYPAYVIGINPEMNEVILGPPEYLESSDFLAENVNLMKYPEIKTEIRANCKIRYNNIGEDCTLIQEDDKIRVIFENPVSAITPGQSAVFYENDDVLGGGIISS